jgi:hypothetical protein
MDTKPELSRRRFLQSAGALSGAVYLRLASPAIVAITQSACTAREQGSAFKVLGDTEAADFAAIAARIIPTTETPGATEAGVIHFIDNVFADDTGGQLAAARSGLAGFNAALAGAHPSAKHLGELDEVAQDAFLATQENSDLFAAVWQLTIFGFFAMSKYGGNKDHVAWDLLEFEGHHGAWTYPFGHYDAEYTAENLNGE